MKIIMLGMGLIVIYIIITIIKIFITYNNISFILDVIHETNMYLINNYYDNKLRIPYEILNIDFSFNIFKGWSVKSLFKSKNLFQNKKEIC